jgi:hypothetical protein
MKPVLLLLAALALGMPAAALAKGPSAASIDGPGTGGGIDIKGDLAPGSPLAELSERSGFFPAVFHQTPDPMRDGRPRGDLGPRYTITYTVPGPEGETFVLHQYVYPYATPSPVTYMEPGQKVFRIETHVVERRLVLLDRAARRTGRSGVPARRCGDDRPPPPSAARTRSVSRTP